MMAGFWLLAWLDGPMTRGVARSARTQVAAAARRRHGPPAPRAQPVPWFHSRQPLPAGAPEARGGAAGAVSDSSQLRGRSSPAGSLAEPKSPRGGAAADHGGNGGGNGGGGAPPADALTPLAARTGAVVAVMLLMEAADGLALAGESLERNPKISLVKSTLTALNKAPAAGAAGAWGPGEERVVGRAAHRAAARVSPLALPRSQPQVSSPQTQNPKPPNPAPAGLALYLATAYWPWSTVDNVVMAYSAVAPCLAVATHWAVAAALDVTPDQLQALAAGAYMVAAGGAAYAVAAHLLPAALSGGLGGAAGLGKKGGDEEAPQAPPRGGSSAALGGAAAAAAAAALRRHQDRFTCVTLGGLLPVLADVFMGHLV
jgi:hypothetical protein